MTRKFETVKETTKNLGLLDDDKIAKALREQKNTKEPISVVLEKMGYISNKKVGKTLVYQLGFLPAPVDKSEIDRSAIESFPKDLLFDHRIIPIKKTDDKVVLGTDDPLNFLAEENMSSIVGGEAELELIRTEDFEALSADIAGAKKEQDGQALKKISGEAAVTGGSDDAPIIKLVNAMISEAVKRRASDIHVEPLENKFRIRYRIDGVLYEIPGPPKRLQGSVISRLKIMAGMDIAEKRLPQDGRINMRFDSRELDLRVSSLPGIHGESIVMRILDKTGFLVGLEDVGFLPGQRKKLENLINLPNGMMLVTGPTGSGKTTTLYSILSHVNQSERKVITIEDPVEYQLDGINQVQVKPQIGLTFAGGLRSMLRQAPDIIMVGEIRDTETARIAIQSALTGHFIFSTLHTNDSPSAVTRLVDMGVKPYLVASTLQGVLAQRLVRMVCNSCREPYKPTEEEKNILSLPGDEKTELYRGKGCSVCNDTGYKGRMGIFELLIITDEIRDLILNDASSGEISAKVAGQGLLSLREDGLEKVKRGYTTIEEVMRVTQDA